MIYCPNKTSIGWKELESAVGEQQAYLFWHRNNGNPLDETPNGEASVLFNKLLQANNGDRISALKQKSIYYRNAFLKTNNWLESGIEPEMTNEVDNEVSYTLKSVNLLMSDKAKQIFEKGSKNNWTLDKVLTELSIPKEQKQLLLDLGVTDREQLISNINPRDGVSWLFESSPELASIGTQAQYSQYLDTVFPDSKVKDIVYHGGKTNKEPFKRFIDKIEYENRNPNSILGFFFSSSKNIVASQYAEKDYDTIEEQLTGDAETDAFIRRSAPLKKGSVSEELLDVKKPYIIQADEWENETWVDKLNILTEKDKDNNWVSDYKWTVDAYEKVKNHLQSLGYDGLYINSDKNLYNKTGIVDYVTVQKVVFEPEQIHILGSKQDIEGFKEFVDKSTTLDLRERLALELASKYGYSIEINTAIRNRIDAQNEFNEAMDPYEYEDLKVELEQNINETYPTQHYSNLTVPGGTNYTENEISTPLITPSIKGHAQFATDKGIGWFRSDEQVSEKEEIWEDIDDWTGKRRDFKELKLYGSKTRRILELQSDLFQKGRDRDELTMNYTAPYQYVSNNMNPIDPHMIHEFSIGDDFYESKVTSEFYPEENQREEYVAYFKNGSEISFRDFSDAIDYYNNNPQSHLDALLYEDTLKKNKFLQLLNKDNNWVTFFIKSIIQDSAKKGYEKVLFPKGETAAKIEGHETIADEIRKIDNDIEKTKRSIENSEDTILSAQSRIDSNKYKIRILEKKLLEKKRIDEDYFLSNVEIKEIEDIKNDIVFDNNIILETNNLQEKLLSLEQQKVNLKSQGIEKLKPIEAFYEIKVGNILEKQFGKDNISTITDEFGNQWREIDLSNEKVQEQTRDILFKREESTNPNIQKLEKARQTVANELNKKEYYTAREVAALKKKYNDFAKSNIKIDTDSSITDMNDQKKYSVIALIKPEAYQKAVESFRQKEIDIPFTASIELNPFSGKSPDANRSDLSDYKARMDKFMLDAQKVSPWASKQALRASFEIANAMHERTGVEFEFLTPDEARKMFPDLTNNEPGIYDVTNNKAYLITGRFNQLTAIHEVFSHPFVEVLRTTPELSHIYDALLKEAKTNVSFARGVEKEYSDFDRVAKDKELITNYIDAVIARKVKEGSRFKITGAIKQFLEAITTFVKKIFNKDSIVNQIKIGTTVDQLTNWLLNNSDTIDLVDGDVADRIREIFSGDYKTVDLAKHPEFGIVVDFGVQMNIPFENLKEESLDRINNIHTRNYLFKRTVNLDNNKYIRDYAGIKERIVDGLRAQLKSVERERGSSKQYRDKLKRAILEVNKNEDFLSATKFILHATDEMNKVNNAFNSMIIDIENNVEINNNKIAFARANFIDFYSSTIKTIEGLKNSLGEMFSDITKEQHDAFVSDLDKTQLLINSIEAKYNVILEHQYKELWKQLAHSRGDVMIDAVTQFNAFTSDRDLSGIMTLGGSIAFSNIPQLQALNRLISRIKNDSITEFNEDEDIKRLIELASRLKKKNLTYTSYRKLYENDENGKPTGYLISPLKYGLFLNRYNSFEKSLNKKYGVTRKGGLPESEEDRMKYIQEKDNWLSEHAERMFTPEYYRIKNSLSYEASQALDDANEQIRKTMNEFIDPSTGKLDTTKMSIGQYSSYVRAKQAKRNLSSITTLTGEIKIGEELRIANEIAEMNKKLRGNVTYSPNYKAYTERRNELKKTLSAQEFANWDYANSKQEIDQSFYDQLDSIEKASQSKDWQNAYDQKKSILADFRHPDRPDVYMYNLIPVEVKEKLKELEEYLFANRAKSKKSDGIKFSDIADIVENDAFRIISKQKMELGKDEMQKFFDENSYIAYYENGTTERKLLPIWTKLVPKDTSLIKTVPSSIWSEVDTKSNFYNEKYKPELAENGYQPKESIYGNKKEFDKIMSDPLMKEIYETVVNVNKKAGKMYHYIEKTNPYRIAQVSGGFKMKVIAEKNIFSGVFNSIRDLFRREEDDIQFGENTYDQLLADGNSRKNVPTAYRNMLDNPASISRDLLGITGMYLAKAIEFKNKSMHEGDLEIFRQGIEKTTIASNKRKNKLDKIDLALKIKKEGVSAGAEMIRESFRSAIERKPAGSSNMFKKAQEVIDSEIYGIVNNPGSAKYMKVISKLIDYARKVNLSFNWPVIFSNFGLGQTNVIKHAMVGFHLTPASLGKAIAEVTINMPGLAKSALDPTHHNKLLSIMQYFNIVSSTQKELSSLHGNSLSNAISEHIFFGPYTAGDFAIKSQLMVALMSEYKYHNGEFYHRRDFINEFYPLDKKAGNTVFSSMKETLYDSMVINKDNGALTIKDKYNDAFNKDLISDVMIKLNRLSSSIDGMFTNNDKSKFGQSIIGKLLLMHRSWLSLALQERLTGLRYDYEQGEFIEGQYIGSFNYVKDKLQEAKLRHSLKGANVNEDMVKLIVAKIEHLQDRANEVSSRNAQFKNTIFELSAMLMFGLIAKILGYYHDDEDEEELSIDPEDRKKSLLDWSYLMALRMTFEMNSMYSPGDTYSLFQSPTAATPFFENMKNNAWMLLDWNEANTIVSRGAYAGHTKLFKSLVKSMPIKNLYEYWNMTDINDKEKYMIGKFLPAYSIFDAFIDSEREKRLQEEADYRQQLELDKLEEE